MSDETATLSSSAVAGDTGGPSTPDPAHADEKPPKWVPVAELAEERAARKAAEKRAAEVDALQARVEEYENASKTEAEKSAARAEAAEKALAEVTARALRLQVAADTGLPADLTEFLTGVDEESMRAQADKLKAATAPSGPRPPLPDTSQGAKPSNPAADIDRRIADAMKAGDIPLAISLKRQKAYAPTP